MFPPHLFTPTPSTPYGAPANYTPGTPVGVQPNQQPADAQPTPSRRQIDIAKNVRHAEFITHSGDRIYMWRFGHFYFANWSDTSMEYGAWSESELPGDYPAGELIKL